MSDQPAQPVDEVESNEVESNEVESNEVESNEIQSNEVGSVSAAVHRQAPSSRDGLIASLLIAAFVVVVDQITKRIAVSQLDDSLPVHVIWTLQWHLTHNSGMAFSRGTGIGPILGALALVVVVMLVISLGRHGTRGGKFAVGLVVGGAVGNLADRLFRGDGWLRGSVVDFIDFQWWPIFNIADSAICIGGALLVLWAIFKSTRDKSTSVERVSK